MAYDPRSVNVPKSVKRMASCYLDHHQRRAFIKSYVKILENQRNQKSSRKTASE
jgi:hypothetical protein